MSSRSRVGRRVAAPALLGGARSVGGRAQRIVGALRAHEHRTAAGLLALFVFAYLWPVLVGGKALGPTSLLYGLTPWNADASASAGLAVNRHLADAALLYYPWDVLARRLLHVGTFPAWNPYALAGTPFFANFQLAWASPFSLPLWLLPLNYGMGVAAAIKLWLAGFGAYLLVRALRLGFWPGIVAGVSYALCAFDVVWLAHGVFVTVAAMLPWALWLVERVLRRGRALHGLALAGVVALIQTGGHPGTQLHVLAATGLYALVRAALCRDATTPERLGRLGLVAGAAAVGTLLSAVVLVPAQQASAETIGVLSRRDSDPFFPGAHISLHVLRTALFPDWWGRPSETEALAAPASYKERTFYAGSATLVLALIALVSPGAWRRKAPFALIALLGVAIAVRSPIHAAVVELPLFDQVQNQRILLWFVFAVPILAAFGLHAVLERPRQRRTWIVVGAALLAPIVAVAGTHVDGTTLSAAARHMLDRSRGTSLEAFRLAAAAWWLLFVLGLAAALLLLRRRPHAAAALVALLAALDLLHFAHGYQSMNRPSSVVPPATPAIAFLQRHVGEGRIVGIGEALPPDFGIPYGLRDVRGRDVPQPTLRFARLWHRLNPEGNFAVLGKHTSTTPKVLGLLGVRYVIAEPEVQVGIPGLHTAYRGQEATVYANAFAVPRAMVLSRVRPAGEVHAEIGAVVRDGFDLRRDGVVRGDQLDGTRLPAAGAVGAARVVRERNAQVTLRATLSRPGLIVLDDAWAPGWSVRVDGRPARALTTDVVLRGVVAPAGTHTVVWSYRVPGLRKGAALSGLGLLIVLGWGGWLLLRARRRRVRRAR